MISETNNNQTNSILRFVLLLVFIGLAFLLFFLYQSRKKTDEQVNFTTITPPVQIVQPLGSFSLNTTAEVTSVDVDKTIDLEIMASSEEKSIVGYDIIVKFEEGAVDIVRVSSLLPDFSLYPTKKSDHYIITGVKKLSSRESTILDDTPLLRLTVMPKKSGALNIAIIERLGLEKTQMVDDKTNIFAPKIGEVTLEVR